MDIKTIFADWTGPISQGFGIADDLRCCAMAAQEEWIAWADYMAEAVARGYNANTAGTCWAFVARQWA